MMDDDDGKKSKIVFSPKSVGDHLGTLVGVRMAQKNNSESVTTKKSNFPNTRPK